MQELSVFIEMAQLVASIIGTLITLYLFLVLIPKRYAGLDRINDIIVSLEGEGGQALEVTAGSLVQIGQLAQNANEILDDPEAFDGILTELATRVRKSITMSMLGTASGDSRKRAKAEELVNEAMITGIEKLNPLIGIVMKATGLDEELRKAPDMLGYIMQAMGDKNLMQYIDIDSLASPAGQPQTQQRSGVDF